MNITRRDLLATGAASPLPFVFASDTPRAPNMPAPANDTDGELKYEHLPRTYEEMLRLSDEQKTMLSAVVASGCDAVAYYTPGANGSFTLNKNIDLYSAGSTRFENTLTPKPERADGLPEQSIAKNGDRTYEIPVKHNGAVKGVIVLHGSNVQTGRDELAGFQYASAAKLKMARDIVNEHADLFGQSGKLLKEREQAHRDLPQKRQFFMTLVKDMFSTFLRNIPQADPQKLEDVANAKNAGELRAALRKRDGNSPVDQYSHVLGVTDLMHHTARLAVNGGEKPVMNDHQIELLDLITLLHDVGKTQIPSQMFSTNFKARDQGETDFGTAVNGSHPLFTLITLLMYERDGLTAAAHHSGIKRYGPEEMAFMKDKKRVSEHFDSFTELKGDDIPADKLPALSKLMRVADVTEAVTGRADKPLHEAVRELGEIGKTGERFKMVRQNPDGTHKITPDTVDPDYLCFMIVSGVFKAYGEQRVAETNGWMNRPKDKAAPQSKYNPAELEKVSAEIVKKFHWDDPEVRKTKSAEIRASIAADSLLRENPGPAQALPGAAIGR